MTPPGHALEVLATGPLALIQDLGRPGLAALGVGRSGAADRASFRLGARLVAQDYAAAGVEVTFGGLVVRARGDMILALTGAPAPAEVNGVEVAHQSLFFLTDGSTLRLGMPAAGLRTYLSVRGGVDVPAILGSRATDMLSRLGPAPLKAGDVLPVGPPPSALPSVDVAPVRAMTNGPIVIRAMLGPRADWLADPQLLAGTWTVSSRSDRVGIRLEGRTLERHGSRVGQELLSEGVAHGSIQVPPGGEPVLFLADHPVTGGYPVVAVVRDADIDLAAQAVPGQSLQISLESL
ncbi:MAG: hypothetical protein QOE58_437 [Actinomycetota bacterium]|jgi:biotin-dependent carboxylase-like uncharacterized protein|nr:hypothetical protein [Actinomycetota bacterium]